MFNTKQASIICFKSKISS